MDAQSFSKQPEKVQTNFMEQGATVKEVYWESLHSLRKSIQDKRRGMLSSGTVLIYDNASLH